jgi:hypothetical protein
MMTWDQLLGKNFSQIAYHQTQKSKKPPTFHRNVAAEGQNVDEFLATTLKKPSFMGVSLILGMSP